MDTWKEVEVGITGEIDGELLPITCLCGHGVGYWEFTISIYDDHPYECPMCGREYYFSNDVKVYCREKVNAKKL